MNRAAGPGRCRACQACRAFCVSSGRKSGEVGGGPIHALAEVQRSRSGGLAFGKQAKCHGKASRSKGVERDWFGRRYDAGGKGIFRQAFRPSNESERANSASCHVLFRFGDSAATVQNRLERVCFYPWVPRELPSLAPSSLTVPAVPTITTVPIVPMVPKSLYTLHTLGTTTKNLTCIRCGKVSER